MEYEKNDEVYSKVVRAGKRTYFFDVKATKGRDLYITMTESKKTFTDGKEYYQKHKIFLYKEDFEKFAEGLSEVVNKIKELTDSGEYVSEELEDQDSVETFSEVSFEDL
ncbi:MAG: hypothetical protein A3D92_09775 [Bacteroidetes bacterium RIFCSPHIGHO2_02_FULL_44_7]|nr:MAG: hypothetical protein A3D92_09775 [Bacteroidetes bacterium RIFCSPHIGHO2_02_FULL_44_7]